MYKILHLIVIAALVSVTSLSVSAQGFPCGTQDLTDCNCGFVGTLVADSAPCGANSGQAQIFLLVDAPNAIIGSDADDNSIIQVSGSGTFNNVFTGDYIIYSLVYNTSDAGTVFPLVAVGNSITTLQALGTQTTAGIWTGTNPNFELIASSLATVNGPECDCAGGGGTATNGGGAACPDLILDMDVTCNYAAGTYVVTVTVGALNGAGAQGYQVSSTHANGFNGIKFGSFVDGPFTSGNGYNYSISSIADPSCNVEINIPIVECTVTPIELIGFDGHEAGTANYLFWETGSEFENSHFDLLRSRDGITYTKVSTIASQGNTNTGNEYEFFDYGFEYGTAYYKLEQYDVNGVKTTIDEIVIIERTATELDVHNVYPVPSSTIVNVDYSNNSNNDVLIRIFDITGKLILESTESASDTVNIFTTDISEYAVGTYIITLNNGSEMVTRKFVKD